MYEVLLSRIFSVTMTGYFHFDFIAISIAMFGTTIGALLVFIFPSYFVKEKVKFHLAISALLLAFFSIFSIMTHLVIPLAIQRSITCLYSFLLTYIILSIPFVFSGIFICLALTRFLDQISKLYAINLIGSALGCITIVYSINFAGALTTVFVIAFLAALSCGFIAIESNFEKLKRLALMLSIFLGLFVFVHAYLVHKQVPLIKVMWTHGKLEPKLLYEKWNAFSRITILDVPSKPTNAFGWGFSPTLNLTKPVSQLLLLQNYFIITYLTKFDGDLKKVDFLKYDISNLVHYIKKKSTVLVVGSGAGRDILSALVFKQKSIVGVELNEDVTNIVNKTYGDFTGHLDKIPNITFINGDIRSYLAMAQNKFDIIHASFPYALVPGIVGYSFLEDRLCTIESWKILLEHLNLEGILSFTSRDHSTQFLVTQRLISLATASLKGLGIKNPREHIIVTRTKSQNESESDDTTILTILVKRSPFIKEEIETIKKITKDMKFELVYTPDFSTNEIFSSIISDKGLVSISLNTGKNISPNTDDKPFFFYFDTLKDVFKKGFQVKTNKIGIFFLLILLLVVLVTISSIVIPILITANKVDLKDSTPFLLFFASIGLGYMLIEIYLLRKLNIFLGYPTYALTVVLFSLLLFSGLGSYLTNTGSKVFKFFSILCLFLLLCIIFAFSRYFQHISIVLEPLPTQEKIFATICVILPLGLFLGTAFPFGMKVAQANYSHLTPWFLGINGATSICASVLSLPIAMNLGISSLLWCGFVCYLIAFGSYVYLLCKESTIKN